MADYCLEQIGDCTGDQEHVFLSLRVCSLKFLHAKKNKLQTLQLSIIFQVIGNMVVALGAARPALHYAVIQCINQPTALPSVQHAAIQVYRQILVPEEVSC